MCAHTVHSPVYCMYAKLACSLFVCPWAREVYQGKLCIVTQTNKPRLGLSGTKVMRSL